MTAELTESPAQLIEKRDIRHLHISDSTDAIVGALLADGVVIVEGFLTPEQVERMNAELDPANEAADATMSNIFDFAIDLAEDGELSAIAFEDDATETFMTRKTKNVTGLAAKSASFVTDVMLHPSYKAVCDAVLLPGCADFLLNHGHLINVGPGARPQPLHRDEGIFSYVPGLGPGSHLQFASIIALVDFTEENGATRVVPGSHLWPGTPFGSDAHPDLADHAVQAVMPAGSIVMYLGWTFHGAGQNRTEDDWRRGLHVSYCQGWLRTEENNTLAVPPAVARDLPERAQELLGYGLHAGAGMVELRRGIDRLRDGTL